MSIGQVFERHRKRAADLRKAKYLRPAGQGFHWVRGEGGLEMLVGSAVRASYQPGQVVTIGSYSGGRQRLILSGPPAGFAGGSLAPLIPRTRSMDGTAKPSVLDITPYEIPVGAKEVAYVRGQRLHRVEKLVAVEEQPDGTYQDRGDITITEYIMIPPGRRVDAGSISVKDADELTLPAVDWDVEGESYALPSTDVLLTEEDGAGSTITAGEEYAALISLGKAGELTVLKSPKASAGSAKVPRIDAVPWALVRREPGNLDIAWVETILPRQTVESDIFETSESKVDVLRVVVDMDEATQGEEIDVEIEET